MMEGLHDPTRGIDTLEPVGRDLLTIDELEYDLELMEAEIDVLEQTLGKEELSETDRKEIESRLESLKELLMEQFWYISLRKSELS